MVQTVWRSGVRGVPPSKIRDDLSRFLREAGGEEIFITRNGKPARVLIGFGSENDWLDYQLEDEPPLSAPQANRLFGQGDGIG